MLQDGADQVQNARRESRSAARERVVVSSTELVGMVQYSKASRAERKAEHGSAGSTTKNDGSEGDFAMWKGMSVSMVVVVVLVQPKEI